MGSTIQVSILAYAAGGAFQNHAHLDLYYNVLAITVLAKFHVARKFAQTGESPDPDLAEAMRPIPQVALTVLARRVSFLR